jgi:hypothetical protein
MFAPVMPEVTLVYIARQVEQNLSEYPADDQGASFLALASQKKMAGVPFSLSIACH